MKILPEPLAFQWDTANKDKNWQKHQVSSQEAEATFFDPHKRILKDPLHSGREERYVLIGESIRKRLLFVVFTIRKKEICIISARDLNKKERKLYPYAKKT